MRELRAVGRVAAAVWVIGGSVWASAQTVDPAHVREIVRDCRTRLGCGDETLAALSLPADRLTAALSAAYAAYRAEQPVIEPLRRNAARAWAALRRAEQPPAKPADIQRCRTEADRAEAAFLSALGSMQAALERNLTDAERQTGANVRANVGVEGAARYLTLAASVREALQEAGKARDKRLSEARAAGNRTEIRRLWREYRELEDRVLTAGQKERLAGLRQVIAANLQSALDADAQAAAAAQGGTP